MNSEPRTFLHDTKKHISLIGFSLSVWVIFCLVEIGVRFIRYATFPWYKGSLIFSVYIGFLLAYGLIGILAGIAGICILRTLSKMSFFKQVAEKSFFLSACQTFTWFKTNKKGSATKNV